MAPWIIAARPPKAEGIWANEDSELNMTEWEKRKAALEAAGAKIIIVEQPALRMPFHVSLHLRLLSADTFPFVFRP